MNHGHFQPSYPSLSIYFLYFLSFSSSHSCTHSPDAFIVLHSHSLRECTASSSEQEGHPALKALHPTPCNPPFPETEKGFGQAKEAAQAKPYVLFKKGPAQQGFGGKASSAKNPILRCHSLLPTPGGRPHQDRLLSPARSHDDVPGGTAQPEETETIQRPISSGFMQKLYVLKNRTLNKECGPQLFYVHWTSVVEFRGSEKHQPLTSPNLNFFSLGPSH